MMADYHKYVSVFDKLDSPLWSVFIFCLSVALSACSLCVTC